MKREVEPAEGSLPARGRLAKLMVEMARQSLPLNMAVVVAIIARSSWGGDCFAM